MPPVCPSDRPCGALQGVSRYIPPAARTLQTNISAPAAAEPACEAVATQPLDPAGLLDAATAAARAAGAELMRRLPAPRDIEWKTYRGERTVVTDADFAADAVIREILTERFPTHVIYSEEFPHDDILGPDVWVIDPLDGTDNYSRGQPQFCVSVAHAVHGRADAGAVFDPIRDEMFTAANTAPAALNGEKIAVSARPNPADATVAWAQRGITPEDSRRFEVALAAAAQRFHRVRMTGAAALEIVWVAAGRYDGALFSNLKWWDHAAAALIARRAGGRATDVFGGDIDPESRRCAFSNGPLHDAILALAHEHGLQKAFESEPD